MYSGKYIFSSADMFFNAIIVGEEKRAFNSVERFGVNETLCYTHS